MKYGEADSVGSFVALGMAFAFDYNAPLKILSILNAANGRPICYIDLDKNLSQDPKAYIRMIERAAQIEALKISNNTTLDLTETLDEVRLAAILKNVAMVSRHAFDLEQCRFDRFERHFCKESNLAHLQIKEFKGYEPSSNFYTGYLETDCRNSISARSSTLPGLMNGLAYKIIHELITKDIQHFYDNSTSNYIRISSRLASLNQILNKNFSPGKKLAGNGHIPLSHQA